MHNEYSHPVLAVPPRAHALHHWDAETGVLRYGYNGEDIIAVRLPAGMEPGYRHGSDGTISSFPYVQQVYMQTDTPVAARVEFALSEQSVSLRPRRAGRGEAVLGLLGRPLLPSVNGLYDVVQDVLIDFHGVSWHWNETEITGTNGRARASITVELSPTPLYENQLFDHCGCHAGEVGDEPDRPDDDAETVEGPLFVFAVAEHRDRSPREVESHQDHRQQAGDGHDLSQDGALFETGGVAVVGDQAHYCGAADVRGQSQPEAATCHQRSSPERRSAQTPMV